MSSANTEGWQNAWSHDANHPELSISKSKELVVRKPLSHRAASDIEVYRTQDGQTLLYHDQCLGPISDEIWSGYVNYGVGWWPNEGFDNELISTLESKATTHEGFLEPMQQGSQYSSSISHKSSVLLLLQAIPNSCKVSGKFYHWLLLRCSDNDDNTFEHGRAHR